MAYGSHVMCPQPETYLSHVQLHRIKELPRYRSSPQDANDRAISTMIAKSRRSMPSSENRDRPTDTQRNGLVVDIASHRTTHTSTSRLPNIGRLSSVLSSLPLKASTDRTLAPADHSADPCYPNRLSADFQKASAELFMHGRSKKSDKVQIKRKWSIEELHTTTTASNTAGNEALLSKDQDVINTAPFKRLRRNSNGITKFGCPFAKHDRNRYKNVHNECTTKHGLEWEHVMNHIQQVHSARHACIYCGQRWSGPDNWETELHQHIKTSQCAVSDADRLYEPECMTTSQEDSYQQDGPDAQDSMEEWVALYTRLFPNEYPIPTPGHQASYFESKTKNRRLKGDRMHLSNPSSA